MKVFRKMQLWVTLFGIILSLGFLTGCGDNAEYDVAKIKLDPHVKANFAGEEYPPITIFVQGPKRPGLLGGQSDALYTAQAEVSIAVSKGSDLIIVGDNVKKTDMGGKVTFNVKAGKKLGDQFLEVIARGQNNTEAKEKIRLISGIRYNYPEEGSTNHNMQRPIKVSVQDATRQPIPNVVVNFSTLDTGANPARPVISSGKTDEDGIVSCEVIAAHKTMVSRIGFDIMAPEQGLCVRNVPIQVMSINYLALIIAVIGGLALFIFGMKLMSDGLHLIAGEKMKKVLEFLTQNRFMGILAGAFVTAIVQSSSATTVMVVGFVNAGLMSLMQSISVIFGANIGTTMTAQIVSFKLDVVAFPAIIIGLIILLLAKKAVTKGWGNTIFGFGMLFFGMSLMSNELKVVGESPSFRSVFQLFDCTPVDGAMPPLAMLGAIFIGTIMTMLIQSSSATIGIAIALANAGLLNYYTAVPLILGDNIGTTVTAFFASIGGTKRAKQAALAHIIFNLFGALYMYLLLFVLWPGTSHPIWLYFVNLVTPGDGFLNENVARHIANAHTTFNIINVIILAPFMGLLGWLVEKIIPIPPEHIEKPHYINDSLLQSPPFAIKQVIGEIRHMTQTGWNMVETAIETCLLPGHVDENVNSTLLEKEDKIDKMQHDLTEFLVKLSQQNLTDKQHEMIPKLIYCNNTAERIADQCESIIKLTKRLEDSDTTLSSEAIAEIHHLLKFLKNQASEVLNAFESDDMIASKHVRKDENLVDKLSENLETKLIGRLANGKEPTVPSVIYIELVAELERISDRFSKMALRARGISKLKAQ